MKNLNIETIQTTAPVSKNQIGKAWKSSLILGLALFAMMPRAWAVSCDAFPQNSGNYCICKSGQVSVGYWYSSGNSPANYSTHNIHLCSDAQDKTCGTAVAGANATIGNLSGGEVMYFANKTAAPIEYFKCTFTKNVGFETTAHAHISAPIKSIGGIIFVVSGLLMLGIFGLRKKVQKSS